LTEPLIFKEPAKPVVARFAPSPTGELHLGNARTALFSLLLAKRYGGRFILRVEDTDLERSKEEYRERLYDDLRWLGIEWDAGPDKEDDRGPYRQALRASVYARFFEMLEKKGAIYPCFCTPLELELSRKAQLSSGRPPRYAGTCRDLAPEQQSKKRAQGLAPTGRFRVPSGQRIEFLDFVHGPQSFLSDDIGDFVVRRADGSAAFFFCNAVDDASMGVTHVLRGEDHLTNTPRQLMLLQAMELPAPEYGHVSLLVGRDGSPLSKRHGATSVREYREQGYLPGALVNHLFRLGHSCAENGFLSLAEMAKHFDTHRLGRAPAHFEDQQLRVWQKEAVHRMSADEARSWISSYVASDLSSQAFIDAVMPNVVLPADVKMWADIVFGDPPALDAANEEVIRNAGTGYFSAAAGAVETSGNDLPAIVGAVKQATGKKGAALYMPLRVALTGLAHGPELAPLLKAISPSKTRERLARFAG
jgi:glutamyl-tRNA synthetase